MVLAFFVSWDHLSSVTSCYSTKWDNHYSYVGLKKNNVGTSGQMNFPTAVVMSRSAVMRSCGCTAEVRSCGCTAVMRSCGCTAVMRSCGCTAEAHSCGCTAVKRSCCYTAVMRSCGCMAVMRSCDCTALVRICCTPRVSVKFSIVLTVKVI